jgi:hypothetical protein
MHIDLRAGFRPSKILLVGALAVFSVTGPQGASAVTLASYSSFSSAGLSITGLRAVDGTPVADDAVRGGGDVFGGEDYRELIVRDAEGNEIPPAGIAEVGYTNGRLFDDEYYVYVRSIIFDYGETFSFENVSDDPLYAALRLNRRAGAEASSDVSTATSTASAVNSGAWGLYFQNAAGDFFGAEDRLSPEAVEALSSSFSVVATSGGETSVSRSILHDFEVLLNPGDTFNVDYFLLPTSGSLENTPAPASVPLPGGAPLLLAALCCLAVSRHLRKPAR